MYCISFWKMVLLVIILAIIIPIGHSYVSDAPFGGSVSSQVLSGITFLAFLWWAVSYFYGGDNCTYIGESKKPKYPVYSQPVYYAPASYVPEQPQQSEQQIANATGGDW